MMVGKQERRGLADPRVAISSLACVLDSHAERSFGLI